MAKQLTFTYNGKDYTLGYTRRTVRQMEANGFVSAQISDKPMTMLPDLFAGAFLMNHRFVTRDVIDNIYEHMPDKEGLISKLADMYNEPIEALMSEPEDSAENVNWVANW
jgi:hypothetical protein